MLGKPLPKGRALERRRVKPLQPGCMVEAQLQERRHFRAGRCDWEAVACYRDFSAVGQLQSTGDASQPKGVGLLQT